ncbi:MAG TPA: F0F1 ATP synthase subunit A [Devosia sp.]|uniref:F0F1 ATP synthase subunit A n=1 Tax=Devosia sp. TaxID=1871048 RepID=UPI002F954F3E
MAGTDPIHQFVIEDMIPIHLSGDGTAGSGLNLSFTNSSLFMVATVVAVSAYMLLAPGKRSLVPNRLQLTSELMYEFIANMLRSSAGKQGMVFFPFVFSLFAFILVANLFGMVPYFFTVTSHIIVTFALAMLVISVVTIYGFAKHGLKFFKLFAPSGIPAPVLLIVVPIEVVSFLSRPISLSVRLFGNILAGHITLKVFTGFVVSLGAAGFLGWLGALLPLTMGVALTALEFLVAAVQAYVFAVLTSMYLNDAVHPSH